MTEPFVHDVPPIDPLKTKVTWWQTQFQALDRLTAAYITDTRKPLSDTSVMELIEWTAKQRDDAEKKAYPTGRKTT